MNIRYKHTNIIARDWQALATFYIDVFGCSIASSQRSYSGDWLAQGTGVSAASLEGVHLKLPGWHEDGPTLEIFSYNDMVENPAATVANQLGLAHIAFEVDDVPAMLQLILNHGGGAVGEVTVKAFDATTLTFVYATDPAGNIIELQNFQPSFS